MRKVRRLPAASRPPPPFLHRPRYAPSAAEPSPSRPDAGFTPGQQAFEVAGGARIGHGEHGDGNAVPQRYRHAGMALDPTSDEAEA